MSEVRTRMNATHIVSKVDSAGNPDRAVRFGDFFLFIGEEIW